MPKILVQSVGNCNIYDLKISRYLINWLCRNSALNIKIFIMRRKVLKTLEFKEKVSKYFYSFLC